MLNKSIKLQILEKSQAFFWIVGSSTESNHIRDQLFVDVLTRFVFLLTLSENLPAAVNIVDLPVRLDQGRITDRVRNNAVLFSHVDDKPIGFLRATQSAIGH